ncbi:MAG: hypothetical protein RMJ17_04140 [Candidatus Aenigmarchaeota archaeon]|nr:hypothetical protein [Candidatus Aenigmarchaeota archaeon]MDW8149747.1 hypothetical protein [Candidatus Aenigmarchaeota archaeon]
MKSQSEIVALVTIAVLTITLVSSAYFWGMPLIEKRQSSIKVERLRDMFDVYSFNSLPSKIENAVKGASNQLFSSPIDGIWKVNSSENYISFETIAKSTNIAVEHGWLSIFDSCNISNGKCERSEGIFGLDKFFCICARADREGEYFRISYKINFRNLTSDRETFEYRVESPLKSTSLKNLQISFSKKDKTNIIMIYFS